MTGENGTKKMRSNLLPSLKKLAAAGGLSKEAVSEVAQKTGVPLNEAYATASFYSYLHVKAMGRNIIMVCKALPCEMKDAAAIINYIKEELGIGPGQTTADGKFSLEVVGCIGACDQAPAMLVNDKLYGNLTRDKVAAILKTY